MAQFIRADHCDFNSATSMLKPELVEHGDKEFVLGTWIYLRAEGNKPDAFAGEGKRGLGDSKGPIRQVQRSP